MSDEIPVFVNGTRLLVPKGATAGAAAARVEPAMGDGSAGFRLTDARGLPVQPGALVAAGMILRVTRTARRPGEADADA
jgi:hypothetical protein